MREINVFKVKEYDPDKVRVIEVISHTQEEFVSIYDSILKKFPALKGAVFVRRFIDPNTGLLGESMVKLYDQPVEKTSKE